MAPTAEQFRDTCRDLAEREARKEELPRKLSGINGAIGEVTRRCIEKVGGDLHKNDCNLSHYLLDYRKETSSLHPIIKETLAGEGAVTERTFLIVGKNFDTQLEVDGVGADEEGSAPRTVTVKYYKGWEEEYPVCCEIFAEGSRELILRDSYRWQSKGIVYCLGSRVLRRDVDITTGIEIKEAMVVALANAAGIKPEDEKSEEFPLLLKELKRIKAEGNI